jgi:lysophospholipase L1-like esterase
MKTHRSVSFLAVLVCALFAGGLCARAGGNATAGRAPDGDTKTVVVLGSSVAAGWVTSHEKKNDMQNGYAARLGRLLASRGYRVVNVSVPGDATAAVLGRFEKDVVPLKPDFVIIGLSLGNEGLVEGDPAEIMQIFEKGMRAIIAKCRAAGAHPIAGSCYSGNGYDADHYRCIKEMNLRMHDWGVPVINFLGAVDDGSGHIPAGHSWDDWHPDNRGHEEMFLAVVPGLFDAIEAGKPAPERADVSGFITFGEEQGPAPLCFIPDDLMHSFTASFEVRTGAAGTIAVVAAGKAAPSIAIGEDGRIAYTGSSSKRIRSALPDNSGGWRHVVLSHRHLQGETLLFVDGGLAGKVQERLEPRAFVVGGPGEESPGRAPVRADFREWLVFRSALNADEVAAINKGKFIRASLEVYAPLDDDSLGKDGTVANLARSTSTVRCRHTDMKQALTAIEEKIAAAAKARASEPVFEEKKPIEVDPAIYDAFEGEYEVAPGFAIKVFREGDRLFAEPQGQGRAELFPESETESEIRFFIKFPIEEITITFVRDGNGDVTQMIFAVGGDEMPAKKK